MTGSQTDMQKIALMMDVIDECSKLVPSMAESNNPHTQTVAKSMNTSLATIAYKLGELASQAMQGLPVADIEELIGLISQLAVTVVTASIVAGLAQ